MSRVTVDCSRFPLVIQNMRFGYTSQEMMQALTSYEPIWAGGRPFALAVWNEPGVSLPDAPMRAMIAGHMAKHAEGIRKTNLVAAIVMPEFSYRAALTAMYWLSPPTSPHRPCASILEAVEHCCEVLTAANIPLNDAIHALRDELRGKMGYGRSATQAAHDGITPAAADVRTASRSLQPARAGQATGRMRR